MRNPKQKWMLAFGLGVLSGCAGTQGSVDSGESAASNEVKAAVPGGKDGKTADVRTTDVDNDGRPEVIKYYKMVDDPEKTGAQKRMLVRQDLDVTWDGRTDIWRYFDVGGKVTREEWDTDYDGNVDETRFFEGGVLVRSERDRNNDGKADVNRYYKDGVLERKESDTNGDGQVDRWEYYNGTALDRIGMDKDHDGTVDFWTKSEKKES
jgi:antitoxin component YwqK of YwqJK toxin-antitoxin module